MSHIPVFVNDASLPFQSDDPGYLLRKVKVFICTLKEMKSKAEEFDREFLLSSSSKLSEMQLSPGFETLSSVLRFEKNLWRYIKNIEQRSPIGATDHCIAPSNGAHSPDLGNQGNALLWAWQNDAFVLSFQSGPEWLNEEALVNICECKDNIHQAQTHRCRNLSCDMHLSAWEQAILDFDMPISSSSVIFSSERFTVKMYLNDHWPPHVHIFTPSAQHKCVGRIRIDTFEVMEDKGIGSLRREIISTLTNNRFELLRGWERCSMGELPVQIT